VGATSWVDGVFWWPKKEISIAQECSLNCKIKEIKVVTATSSNNYALNIQKLTHQQVELHAGSLSLHK